MRVPEFEERFQILNSKQFCQSQPPKPWLGSLTVQIIRSKRKSNQQSNNEQPTNGLTDQNIKEQWIINTK